MTGATGSTAAPEGTKGTKGREGRGRCKDVERDGDGARMCGFKKKGKKSDRLVQ
jgi:hypothetical protein